MRAPLYRRQATVAPIGIDACLVWLHWWAGAPLEVAEGRHFADTNRAGSPLWTGVAVAALFFAKDLFRLVEFLAGRGGG